MNCTDWWYTFWTVWWQT